jgi:heptosyltransferase-1
MSLRVLIIKTSSLGDVIHTLPAITDAMRALPGIEFDWIVEEAFAEIPAWHPAVKKVIPIALRRWRKAPLSSLLGREFQRFKLQLKMTRYDLVIDAQGLVKSAWLTRLVNAPSVGYDKQSIREPLASMFYKKHIHVSKEQHAVERIRELFAQALGYIKPQAIGDYAIRRELLQAPTTLLADNRIVLLHGTTRADKYWPDNNWIELAKNIRASGVLPSLPWGNDEEKQRAETIASATGSEVLPKLKLAEIAAILAQAKAVIAVDTGLGHLAAALDVPCVSLYGPTSPMKVGAYGKQQIHLCAEVGQGAEKINNSESMQTISVDRVNKALLELLNDSQQVAHGMLP